MAEWMDELERLAELRDKGLITDDEYEAERAKIVPAPASIFSEAKQEPDIKSESPPLRPTENKRVKWTKLNKIFLIICSSLYAIGGPYLIWYNREYALTKLVRNPITQKLDLRPELKTRLSFSEDIFGLNYPEDSIWGEALLVDAFFGALFGLVFGLILVKIWHGFREPKILASRPK